MPENILADTGCAERVYVTTPIDMKWTGGRVSSPREAEYNRRMPHARVWVENSIGAVKQRF